MIKSFSFFYITILLLIVGVSCKNNRNDNLEFEKIDMNASKVCSNNGFDLSSNVKMFDSEEMKLDNLVLLGKIWGFLKYRHPKVCSGKLKWDEELFQFLPVYLEVTNKVRRDEVLLQWINSYGNLEKCQTCVEVDSKAVLKPNFTWINNLESNLAKKLWKIHENRHQGPQFYVREVSYGANNFDFTNEELYTTFQLPDYRLRLLSIYRYWNIVEYFYPHKHTIGEDWDKILRKYLPKFANAKNRLDYEVAMVQLISETKDTHNQLFESNSVLAKKRGEFYPPFRTRFIEGKLVVTDFYVPESQRPQKIEIGDVLTHIGKKTVKSIVDSLLEYYPASNSASKLRDIAKDILRSNKRELEIKLISPTKELRSTIRLFPKDSLEMRWYAGNKKGYRILTDKVGYIKLSTVSEGFLKNIHNTFKTTKGVIVDIREYPSSGAASLWSYFIPPKTEFVKFTIGNINNPGEFNFTEPKTIQKYSENTNVAIAPYGGKLAVLLDENTQSLAEYTAMAFRSGKKTTILGDTTAGTDGNASLVFLPGGLMTQITGIGVYYPNGNETQRIGIVPDVKIKPTVKGIRKGRDEILEKAIDLIK